MSLERKRNRHPAHESAKIIRLEKGLEASIGGTVERVLCLRSAHASAIVYGIPDYLETLLAALGPREYLTLRLPLGGPEQPAIGLALAAPSRRALNERKRTLGSSLDTVLSLALPAVTAAPCLWATPHRPPHRHVVDLHPAGRPLGIEHMPQLAPRLQSVLVRGSSEHHLPSLHVAADLHWHPDLAALGRLRESPDLQGVEVSLAFARFRPDAGLFRTLKELATDLMRSYSQLGERDPLARAWLDRALPAVVHWFEAGPCLRMTVQLGSPRPVSLMLRDLVCKTLYGAPALDSPPAGILDLANAWPACDLGFLQRLPLFLAEHACAEASPRRSRTKSGTLFLGRRDGGRPLLLGPAARAQHMFILGETGTGKSTFIRGLVEQDIANGEAVVLFDPHGDLYRDVRALVPARRRGDVVLVHPCASDGAFTLNILEPLGDDLAVERARVVDDLIDVFKKMYKGTPQAFGPMWEKYFRNAIYLLMNVHGRDASLLDVQRIFADEDYLDGLIRKCTDRNLRAFWQGIARKVYHDGENPSLANIAPYIVAKLAHFADNPVMARIFAPGRSSLDFRRIVAERRICLVNLAQSDIGNANAQFLGSLLFTRLSAALKTQVHLRPKQRIPLSVYLDEYHTYASDSLAESMAQMRKFGLRYVLANQHLGQVDGGGVRPDVGKAVLGNAANKIVFRIGLLDAHFLAPWFAPHMSPLDLINLPNFHAAARILEDNAPRSPVVFRTERSTRQRRRQ